MRSRAGNVTCSVNIFSPREHGKGGVNTSEYVYAREVEQISNFNRPRVLLLFFNLITFFVFYFLPSSLSSLGLMFLKNT